MFYKGVKGEFDTLVDFMNPLTNVSQFEENGCNYWSEWAGDKGELNLDYYNRLHPQLEFVIEQIKRDPQSRRHVVSLWNHETIGEVSLPCCWHNLTFSVIDDLLHLTWTQRSVDTAVGLPSDVYLAYLFMDHVARQTGLRIGSCMFSLSNVHIYTEHLEGVNELLLRTEADYEKPLKFQLKA
jgi:thymidylate synthase